MNNTTSMTMPSALEKCSSIRLRNVRDLLASLLLALPLFLACAALARAQQMSGTEPGDQDPVGSPAKYLTLRTDDLLIGKYAAGNVNQLDTYESDKAFWAGLYGAKSDPTLNLPLRFVLQNGNSIATNASGLGVLGGGTLLTASGRILSQENDQVKASSEQDYGIK
jgi:hypothetical protein